LYWESDAYCDAQRPFFGLFEVAQKMPYSKQFIA
jgi:hypothetical protein